MNITRGTRRSKRRSARRAGIIRLLNGLIAVLVLTLGITGLYSTKVLLPPTTTVTPVVTNAVPAQRPTPTAAPSTPAVSPTPTPMPTETVAPLDWHSWSFDWATLTVPKTTTPEVRAQHPAAVIEQAAITPLQPSELVQKPYVNSAGQTALYEAIEPATKQSITWDTLTASTGGVLSAAAENTVYLYCHDYADNTALCSVVFDVLVVGDEIQLETATEVLTYRLTERFNVLKGDLSNDTRITAAVADRLILITCNSGGQRIDGDTVENSAMVFELVSSSRK